MRSTPSTWSWRNGWRVLAALAVVALPTAATAQQAPIGAHDGGQRAPRVSATGGYPASIPLAIPPERTGTPVPVALHYDARPTVGEAGVGWRMQTSYVVRERTLAYRRPAFTTSWSTPEVWNPRRVELVLHGKRIAMTSKATGFRAITGSPALRLVEESDELWTLDDGRGHQYRFEHIPGLGDNVWMLTEIVSERGEQSRVVFDYEVEQVWVEETLALPEIRLRAVRFNFHPGGGCAKHEIRFDYTVDPTGTDPQAGVLATEVIGGEMRVRTQVLSTIAVAARGDDCASDLQDLSTYELTYSPDGDTTLPRLTAVDLLGREGTAEHDRPLAIARFGYGQATWGAAGQGEDSVDPSLVFAASAPVPVGVDVDAIGRTRESNWTDGFSYVTEQAFMDVTGDALPELLFAAGGLEMARNHTGTSLGGLESLSPGGAPFDTISTQVTSLRRYQYGTEQGTESTWTQFVDMNGDGRVDLVDASGDPDTWVVYVNTPVPSDPTKVEWEPVEIDMTNIRDTLISAGWDVDRLPLARSKSARAIRSRECWTGEMTDPDDPYSLEWVPCPDGAWDVVVGNQFTITEWKLADVNGDGYPDLVVNRHPSYVRRSSDTELRAAGNYPCSDLLTWTPSGGETWCTTSEETLAHPLDDDTQMPVENQMYVFYNRLGARMQPFALFADWIPVPGAGSCSVERWESRQLVPGELGSSMTCGLIDVNGDGLLDRVRGEDAYLGTGDAFDHHIELPGHGRSTASARPSVCDAPDAQPGDEYLVTTRSGLLDLTGDGLPDYVAGGSIRVGMGTSWREPIPIQAPQGFAISTTVESCEGNESSTRSGLFDINGDGRLDYVVAGTPDGAPLPELAVYEIAGWTAGLGALDGGRITSIHNGHGGVTRIRYTSAKRDGSTLHQVPSPEIVVSDTRVEARLGLATSIRPTYHAYGDALTVYDGVADRFVFKGYGRQVSLSGSNESERSATIRDAVRPEDTSLGYPRHALVGLTRDEYELHGALPGDPWSMLTMDPAAHAAWSAHRATQHSFVHDEGGAAIDCTEWDPYELFPLAFEQDGTYDFPCNDTGVVYPESTTTRRGDVAPPSTEHVETRTTIAEVDGLGRPTLIHHEGDTHRGDDDVCERIHYAIDTVNPQNATLVARRQLYVGAQTWSSTAEYGIECHEVERELAAETHVFDGEFLGTATRGAITQVLTSRHDVETGELVDDGVVAEIEYDAWGAPTTVVAERDDGVVKRVDLSARDPFRLATAAVVVEADDVNVAMESFAERDPNTLELDQATSPNGVVQRWYRDGYGRPTMSTYVDRADDVELALSATSYLGDTIVSGGQDQLDPLGRRVVERRFAEPVPADTIDPATAEIGETRTIVYLDELGRSRHAEQPLGPDYGGETMIVGDVEYGDDGRPRFVADPYAASEPEPRFGVTYSRRPDGSVACAIQGRGQQPTGTAPTTSVAEGRFVRCADRRYSGYQRIAWLESPNARDPGSPEYGAIDEIRTTATGRVLERQRQQFGTVLDRIRFEHDVLGNATTITRYTDPQSYGGPVQWHMAYDSSGSVLRMSEPGAVPKSFEYDRWGALRATSYILGADHWTVFQLRDGLGRVRQRSHLQNGIPEPGTTTWMDYDQPTGADDHIGASYLVGRLSHAYSEDGQHAYFGYDELGRPEVVSRVGDDGERYTERYEYRLDGSLSALTFSLPDAGYAPETALYSYDSAGRVAGVAWHDESGASDVFTAVSIDPRGRYSQVRLGNGLNRWEYHRTNDRRELYARVLRTDNGGTYSYTGFTEYDGELGLQQRMDYDNFTGGKLEYTSYTYDASKRLVRMAISDYIAGAVFDEEYEYDGLGNRTRRTDHFGNKDIELVPQQGDPDRICTVKRADDAITLFPNKFGCDWLYDAHGNVTRTNGSSPTRFSYDAESRIKEIRRGTVTAQFGYGPLGDITTVDVDGGTTADVRVDRRYGPLVEKSMYTDGGGWSTAIERRIPGPFGVLMSRVGTGPGATVKYWHADGVNNRFFTNEDGAVIQKVEYGAFGDVRSDSGAASTTSYTKYLYNQGDTFGGLGVSQVGARIYHPDTGRFVQRDPLVVPRTSSRTSPYAFAWNDPIDFADPSGLDPVDELCTTCNNAGDAATYALATYLAGKAWNYFFGGGSDGRSTGQPLPQIPYETYAPLSRPTAGDPPHIEFDLSETMGRSSGLEEAIGMHGVVDLDEPSRASVVYGNAGTVLASTTGVAESLLNLGAKTAGEARHKAFVDLFSPPGTGSYPAWLAKHDPVRKIDRAATTASRWSRAARIASQGAKVAGGASTVYSGYQTYQALRRGNYRDAVIPGVDTVAGVAAFIPGPHQLVVLGWAGGRLIHIGVDAVHDWYTVPLGAAVLQYP